MGSFQVPNKKWPSSLERGMLLVRRARRWALRKLICKIERHDDSKTISWHASFPVRFARLLAALPPKLASSRLRQRLFGAATSQTSRRKPRYRQSDLFSDSSWLYYFTHYFLRYRSFAHCQKLLACRGSLKRNSLSSQKAEHEKTVSTLFTILMRNVLILKIFCVHQRGKRLFPASV